MIQLVGNIVAFLVSAHTGFVVLFVSRLSREKFHSGPVYAGVHHRTRRPKVRIHSLQMLHSGTCVNSGWLTHEPNRRVPVPHDAFSGAASSPNQLICCRLRTEVPLKFVILARVASTASIYQRYASGMLFNTEQTGHGFPRVVSHVYSRHSLLLHLPVSCSCELYCVFHKITRDHSGFFPATSKTHLHIR